jgi:hypothetical protein
MYATACPDFAMVTLAPSCLNRPMAVCLRGVEFGVYGSTSTIQPNRFASFGFFARSNRSSARSHRRLPAGWRAATSMPYRASRALVSPVAASPPTKYWLKFSSPDSTVPHGVTPPAQLLSVPTTSRPAGSAAVRTNGDPATGPVNRKVVDSAVIRRLYRRPPWRTGVQLPVRPTRSSSTTDMPCAAIAVRSCSTVSLSRPGNAGNIRSSLVYSRLGVLGRGERRGRAGTGEADDQRTDGPGADDTAAGDRTVDDVAEVGVVRGVGCGVVAGVAAAVKAGHRVSSAVCRHRGGTDERQEAELRLGHLVESSRSQELRSSNSRTLWVTGEYRMTVP